ncbi:MAG: hypothetical protein RKO66_17355 [Candidatus Contendobacter sp.]|nr:hypothetical protein [Candidatus Contendobacter sp.]
MLAQHRRIHRGGDDRHTIGRRRQQVLQNPDLVGDGHHAEIGHPAGGAAHEADA